MGIVDRLDGLREDADDHSWKPDAREVRNAEETWRVSCSMEDEAAFIAAIFNAWPALSARLRAAEALIDMMAETLGGADPPWPRGLRALHAYESAVMASEEDGA